MPYVAYAQHEDNIIVDSSIYNSRLLRNTFPSAEVDMHFSLNEDLTPLEELFDALRRGGPPMASMLLERGRL